MSYLEDLFSLRGLTAVVTGASRGIGRECAAALSGAGANCFGLSRSPIPEKGAHDFNYESCDIADSAALGRSLDRIALESGRIDILVNAAGITVPAAEGDLDAQLANFDRTQAVNVRAVYAACLLASGHMKKNGGGSIINITSIAGEFGFPGNPAYVASKGGLRLLSKALALDMAPFGIRVNNVAPGYVRTAMTERSYQDPVANEVRRRNTMLGRWGEAHDVAGAVVFLSSPSAAYVTGVDLYVDGGWSAKGMS